MTLVMPAAVSDAAAIAADMAADSMSDRSSAASAEPAAHAATLTVTLAIVPDEEHAYATLAAYDEWGAQLAQVRVAPAFRLSKASAAAWIENGYRRPA